MCNKIFALTIIVILTLLLFTGCPMGRDTHRHYDGYPEYFSIAIYSLLGVSGTDSDYIEVLEKDAYGRVMFLYDVFGSLDRSGERAYYSIIICQKNDEEFTYFYPDCNFVYAQTKEGISEEAIESLKDQNDWGQELDESKLTRVRITDNKTIYWTVDMPDDEKRVLADVVDFENEKVFFMDFAPDQNGRWIFYVTVTDMEWNFKRAYLLLLNKDGTYDEETYLQLIDDIWDYQDQLKEFKKRNDWVLYVE